jgi:hypothetical protein
MVDSVITIPLSEIDDPIIGEYYEIGHYRSNGDRIKGRYKLIKIDVDFAYFKRGF